MSEAQPSPLPICTAQLSKNGLALELVQDVMKAHGYYLFRGQIWFRDPASRCTKTFLQDADRFLGHLISNPTYKAQLLDRKAFLNQVLSDKRCTIVPQVELDVDTVEVKDILNSKIFLSYLIRNL